jgi:hypothetical protein
MAEISAYIFLKQNDIYTADGYILFSVYFIKYAKKNVSDINKIYSYILCHDQLPVMVTHFQKTD